VGTGTITCPRPDGTSLRATVYYPARQAGLQQPVHPSAAPGCPIIFESVVPPSAYSSTLTHLASWGFVVAMPNFTLRLFPDTDAMAADLGICLDGLLAESARPGALLFGAVRGDRCGFSGHSLGGACAVIQGVRESDRLKVIVSLASGNRTQPPASSVAGQLRRPLILLAGSRDWISSLPTHVGPIYAAASAPKGLFLLSNGNHMQFSDSTLAPTQDGLMSQEEQLAITRHYLTAAFRLYLSEADELWPLLWDPQSNALPHVGPLIDSGSVWETPAVPVGGVAGETVELAATVVNRSASPQGFDLFVDSGWPATIAPQRLDPLPPGGSATVTVSVTIPARELLLENPLRLSARSTRDNHTRGVAHTTITRRLPLPVLRRTP
jgi:hypothetical protein